MDLHGSMLEGLDAYMFELSDIDMILENLWLGILGETIASWKFQTLRVIYNEEHRLLRRRHRKYYCNI